MRLVIVGNGAAGMQAALEARRLAPAAEITVVSEESEHGFSRPALMYLLAGQLRLADTEPQERSTLAKHRLEMRRARAVGLDPVTKTLLLEGGALPYDRLLVATGAGPIAPPWPGSDLAGVGAFVTMADLAWLEDALGLTRSGIAPRPGPPPYGLRPGPRHRPVQAVAVIGGGPIALEVAETLRALGRRVHLVVRQEWLAPMGLDGRQARWITERARAAGVEVHAGASVERFEGEGALEAVVTSEGRVKVELAVVAIGVAPNTGWLGGALALDGHGAVQVDAGLAASAMDVFAAGDCAAAIGAAHPASWRIARAQGLVAGQRLAGQDARYAPGVWHDGGKFFDLEHTVVGALGTPAVRYELRHEERGAVRSCLRLAFGEAGLLGVSALGRRWDDGVLRRWIAAGRDEAFVLAHLPEAAFDAEFVPPLRAAAWERS